MSVPMSFWRANYPDSMHGAIALGPPSHAVEVRATPTLQPFDRNEPIIHLDWQTRAACRGMGSDLFFPTSGDALGPATRICARCPVLEECRTTALDDPSLYGIWAGTSVRERRRLRSEGRGTGVGMNRHGP